MVLLCSILWNSSALKPLPRHRVRDVPAAIASSSLQTADQCGVHFWLRQERDNIDADELATLRDIAKGWLEADAAALARALEDELIEEVAYDGEDSEDDEPAGGGAGRNRGRRHS
jgi:hypothetical protein